MTKRNKGQDPAKQPFNLPRDQINKTGKRKGNNDFKKRKKDHEGD